MQNPILKVSKDYFEFHFPNGFVYDISKKECRSEQDWNEWIAKLSDKNWWSKQLEDQFITLFTKYGQSSN